VVPPPPAGAAKSRAPIETHVDLPARQVKLALAVLLLLIFSKYFYLSSLTSYYTFYLIQRFQVSVENAQIHLFVFLASLAFGTLVGGPIGDRFGRKIVIWCSILGALPFTLVLPYVDLFWTGILTVVIALILSSAFSAIVVYGQELIPGKVGMVAGLFFGAAFGMSGHRRCGTRHAGRLHQYYLRLYRVVAFLPLMGLITVLLPNLEPARRD